ncbi:MAG: DUF429 domain-containing protein [Deltaproteobacteria bacterium]|nr:DUF429 domain-containing protein [Deltaproteobacteria bacterium]
MRIFGVDFTSAPSRRKPITYTECELTGTTLRYGFSGRLEDFSAFEAFLETPGPWVAAFDFPFGQPRKLLDQLGLRKGWSDYVLKISELGMKGWDTLLQEYRDPRPAGDKEHRRETDVLAASLSPMKMYGIPVGKMFFQGAPRLLKSGVCILPCRPNASDRKAVEGYPKLIAQQWAGREGYKNDQKSKQTPAQVETRKKIVAGLNQDLFRVCGLHVEIDGAVQEALVSDASGDTLDGFLCAIQAAWAARQPDSSYGIPAEADPDEGWIAGSRPSDGFGRPSNR